MALPARLTPDEFRAMSRDLPPPTSDDVSITNEGVRLDSKEKVLAFLAQLDRERHADRHSPRE